MSKPVVFEASWKGKPTFLIAYLDENGEPYRALKWIEVTDGTPCWISGDETIMAMAWHFPDREYVEQQLEKLLKRADNGE